MSTPHSGGGTAVPLPSADRNLLLTSLDSGPLLGNDRSLLEQYFTIRHKTFVEDLEWVKRDKDRFDYISMHFAVTALLINPETREVLPDRLILSLARAIVSNGKQEHFMYESVRDWKPLRDNKTKEIPGERANQVELSRLCLSRPARQLPPVIRQQILDLLYKYIFQWATGSGKQYFIAIMEKSLYRYFKRLKYHWNIVSQAQINGNKRSTVLVYMDIQEAIEKMRKSRPSHLAWLQGVGMYQPFDETDFALQLTL